MRVGAWFVFPEGGETVTEVESFKIWFDRKIKEDLTATRLPVDGEVVTNETPCKCQLCFCGCYLVGDNVYWVEKRADGKWIHDYCGEEVA